MKTVSFMLFERLEDMRKELLPSKYGYLKICISYSRKVDGTETQTLKLVIKML